MLHAIRGGHNFNITGASEILDEVTENRKIYPKVIEYLQIAGEETIDCTPEVTETKADDLNYGVSMANSEGAHLFASIHLNCSNGAGYGTEVLYKTEEEKIIAERIVNKLAALGFKNRGVKEDKRGLYEFAYCDMPNVIVECFFCDNQEDVDLYNSIGPDAIGKSIAEGILGRDIVAETPSPVEEEPKIIPLPQIEYQVHVQNKGWLGLFKDGDVAGSVGEGLRLESLSVFYRGTENFQMSACIQGQWQNVRGNGEVVGTMGRELKLEGLKIKVDGRRVAYQVHVEGTGWMSWCYDGEVAGLPGRDLRIEAIRILIEQ